MKTAVHGFATKTITIPTSASQYYYNIGDYQQDNFGSDAKILAMSIRVDRGNGTTNSNNDRPLIETALSQRGYLSLVQDGINRENVVYQGSLYTLSREDGGSYDLFFEPCKINWDESVIQFDSGVTIDGTRDIELVVYYIFNENNKKVEPNIIFDNNFNYIGLKKYNLEVVTQADNRIFNINNGRNPLGACALLVGMRINNFSAVTLKGNTAITTADYLGASFLTMKFESNKSMLDKYPLPALQPLAYLGYPFFPIIPTLATDYQWSECQIEVSNKSIPNNGNCYLITFFYIDVNIKEWTAMNK